MDRVAIKEKAKKMIVGNKWYLWKPLVFVSLIIFGITFVIGFIVGLLNLGETTTKTIFTILEVISSFIEMAFAFGYAKYVLDFVRDKKADWKIVIDYTKEHFIPAIIVSILVALIICGCSILLVIPGIIAAVGLTFYQEVFVDNESLGAIEVIKKSWAITKGHKMDIFVFMLSFLGWIILAGFTLGILYIWLTPYMMVSLVLVYEELKK